jgi:molybdate transport system permease protein
VFIHASREAFLKAFRDEAILQSVKLSLITSLTSTFLSLLVAIPAGYLLSRYHFPGHAFLDTLLDLPIVLPPLVMGLALLIFFNTSLGSWLDRGIVKGGLFVYQPLGIILTQTIVGSAFATRVIKAGFDTFDKRYEEVAMALGANRWQTFVKVVIPSTIPSLVAGAVISWARIFGLFGPILLVCGTMRGHTEIMPTTIFLELSIGRLEVALIIGAVMVVLSTTTLIIFKRLGGKGYLW